MWKTTSKSGASRAGWPPIGSRFGEQPVPSINLNRKLTGQSDPHCKLIQATGPPLGDFGLKGEEKKGRGLVPARPPCILLLFGADSGAIQERFESDSRVIRVRLG